MNPEMPKISLYRNISIIFVVVTVVLLVAAFFIFYSQATIIVSTNNQDVNLSFNAEVKENPDIAELAEKDVLSGRLVAYERSASSNFKVLSTKTVNSEMVGKVKIVNQASHRQTLVRTTQLQADNGVIVRTNKQVVIPAGGSVIVEVFPKDPANFETIEPGNLVIIKLGKSLQDKIYGIAEMKLTDQPYEVKVLAESDITRAQKELTAQMIDDLKNEIGATAGSDVMAEAVESSVNAKIGDEVDSFTLDLTLNLKTVDFDRDQMAVLLDRKVKNLNLGSVVAADIDWQNFSYKIADPDYNGGVLLKINYVLSSKVDAKHPVLNKDNFAGKSLEEVKAYLKDSDLINEAEVYISPYWKKTMPKKHSKIRIFIK